MHAVENKYLLQGPASNHSKGAPGVRDRVSDDKTSKSICDLRRRPFNESIFSVGPDPTHTIHLLCKGKKEFGNIRRVVLSIRIEGDDDGAPGQLKSGCHPGDCHYTEGNYITRRRGIVLKNLLSTMGFEKSRFEVKWVSAAEGAKFAEVIREFVEEIKKIGPNPLSRMTEVQSGRSDAS